MTTQRVLWIYTLIPRLNDLLDRLSEGTIVKLSAVSVALFGLGQGISLAAFPDRYVDSPSLYIIFDVANIYLWALAFIVAGGAVLVAALRDRPFAQGALIGLMAVHSFYGAFTIPAFLFGAGLPTAFLQFAGNGVWCLVTFLLWRLRVRRQS